MQCALLPPSYTGHHEVPEQKHSVIHPSHQISDQSEQKVIFPAQPTPPFSDLNSSHAEDEYHGATPKPVDAHTAHTDAPHAELLSVEMKWLVAAVATVVVMLFSLVCIIPWVSWWL